MKRFLFFLFLLLTAGLFFSYTYVGYRISQSPSIVGCTADNYLEFMSQCWTSDSKGDGMVLESSNAVSRTATQDDVYCGADLGATLTEGDYTLRSSFDELSVGHLTLVSGKPHDGLHRFSANGFPLYQLNQYASCNSESVRMFRVDNDGIIHEVLFEKNGEFLKEVATDYLGTVKEEGGFFSFCPYDNVSGKSLCDSYEFDGSNFVYASSLSEF